MPEGATLKHALTGMGEGLRRWLGLLDLEEEAEEEWLDTRGCQWLTSLLVLIMIFFQWSRPDSWETMSPKDTEPGGEQIISVHSDDNNNNNNNNNNNKMY